MRYTIKLLFTLPLMISCKQSSYDKNTETKQYVVVFNDGTRDTLKIKGNVYIYDRNLRNTEQFKKDSRLVAYDVKYFKEL